MEALSLIGCGVVSGLLAGMLGIGGGLVIVPALYLCLRSHGVAVGLIPQMAVATSLAAMIPTALAASLAQVRRGALDWRWLRRLAPGVALGAALGTVLAHNIRGSVVSLVFVAYATFFAWRMLRSSKPAMPASEPTPALGEASTPTSLALCLPVGVVAALIGISSAIAGIGGAIVTVPYLVARSVDLRRAIAASSAVTLVISVAATFANGLQAAHERAMTGALSHANVLGPIYWPAALVIGVTALLCAPCGVAWSHRVPVLLLKRTFALLTLAAAAGTLASLLR